MFIRTCRDASHFTADVTTISSQTAENSKAWPNPKPRNTICEIHREAWNPRAYYFRIFFATLESKAGQVGGVWYLEQQRDWFPEEWWDTEQRSKRQRIELVFWKDTTTK